MRNRWLCVCLLLTGCGYHFEGEKTPDQVTTITIPYIKGDSEGLLNSELAKVLSVSGGFDYRQSNGALILEASIISEGDDRIGYRYDRNPTNGKLRDNIVGTENRRTLAVEIKLIDAHSEEIVLGPEVVHTTVDYDYVDNNSIRDLVFVTEGGPQTVLNFSLGQLDSVEGAHDDADGVIYRLAAQKIVQKLLLQRLN